MSLPTRGTGLLTGRAGERRYGNPRTYDERVARHKKLQTLEINNTIPYVLIVLGVGLALVGIGLRK